jgi:hypothetical protein
LPDLAVPDAVYGPDDDADPAITCRLLTIMLPRRPLIRPKPCEGRGKGAIEPCCSALTAGAIHAAYSLHTACRPGLRRRR